MRKIFCPFLAVFGVSTVIFRQSHFYVLYMVRKVMMSGLIQCLKHSIISNRLRIETPSIAIPEPSPLGKKVPKPSKDFGDLILNFLIIAYLHEGIVT